MATTTVRISKEDRDTLREIVAKTGETAGEVLHKAMEDYRRRCFLEDANRAFGALQKNAKAWRDERKERKVWDATIADGLEDK